MGFPGNGLEFPQDLCEFIGECVEVVLELMGSSELGRREYAIINPSPVLQLSGIKYSSGDHNENTPRGSPSPYRLLRDFSRSKKHAVQKRREPNNKMQAAPRGICAVSKPTTDNINSNRHPRRDVLHAVAPEGKKWPPP